MVVRGHDDYRELDGGYVYGEDGFREKGFEFRGVGQKN